MPKKSAQATVAETIPISSGRYEIVAVCDILTSDLNPRRHFNDEAHAELVESVKKHGVLQPVLLRPLNAGGYEIVAGERRVRAAKAARLIAIPAIVREMDDRTALEVAVIENLQRTDLHPLEEADGYRRLIDEHGYHVEQLAGKVGKSKAYIYARLKLAEMPAAAREHFHAGRLDASTALLVARIGTEEHAERAARVIAGQPASKAEEQEWRQAGGREEYSSFDDELEPWDEDKVEPEDFDRDGSDDDDEGKRKPLTYRQAQSYVRKRFMLRLDEAPFPVEHAALITGIGPCLTCPKRTGNQPDLFGDVRNADVCTDIACFDAKRKAHADVLREEAIADGKRVLTAKESKGVWHYGSINRGSGYAEPKGECHIDPEGRTWPQVLKSLGKAAPERVVAIDGERGKAVELVKTDEVAAALKAKGIKPREGGQAPSGRNDDWRRQQEAETRKREAAAAERDACIQVIVSAVERLHEMPTELLRVVALGAMGVIDADWSPLLRRRGYVNANEEDGGDYDEEMKALRKLVAGSDAGQLRGLLVDMALTADQPMYGKALGLLELAAAALDIDLKPIRAAAKKAHQASVKAAGKKPKPEKPKTSAKEVSNAIQCRTCGVRMPGLTAMAEHVATDHADEATCVRCGCQEATPCPDGCAWTSTEPGPEGDICTACVTADEDEQWQGERADAADAGEEE